MNYFRYTPRPFASLLLILAMALLAVPVSGQSATPVTEPEPTATITTAAPATPSPSPEGTPTTTLDQVRPMAIAECAGVPGTQLDASYSNFRMVVDGVETTEPTLRENSTVDLRFDWSIPGEANPCDYFVFQLPAGLSGTPVMPFDITHQGLVVGEGTVDGSGALTVRFNNEVVQVGTALSGTVTYTVRVSVEYVEGEERVPIHFSDTATVWIILQPGLGPAEGIFRKDGWTYGTSHVTWPDRGVFWRINIPVFDQDLHNVVVQDVLSQNTWEFNCSSGLVPLNVTVVQGDPDLVDTMTFSCTAGNFTMTMPLLPAGTQIQFQMVGRVLEGFGPFTNTAILDADEITPITTPIHTIDARGSGTVDGEVVPATPSVVNGMCVGGVYTPPAVTPQTTVGITYVVSPNPLPSGGGAFVVTASLQDGYSWATTGVPAGWVLDAASGTYAFAGSVTDDPCDDVPPPGVDPSPTPTQAPGITPPVVQPSPTPTQGPGITPPTADQSPTPPPHQVVPTSAPTNSVTGLPSTGTGHNGTHVTVIGLAIIALGLVAAGIRSTRPHA